MFLDDLERNRQAHARAFADVFSREKWVKNLGQNVRRNATAVVGDFDPNHVLVFHRGAQGNNAWLFALRHGVHGVGDDVEEDLVDLRRGAADFAHSAKFAFDFHLVLEQVLGQHERAFQAIFNRELTHPGSVKAAEVFQVLNDFGNLPNAMQSVFEQAPQFVHDMVLINFRGQLADLGELPVRFVLVAIGVAHQLDKFMAALGQVLDRVDLVIQHLKRAFHVSQWGVDFVRDAGHHLAQGRHFFRLDHVDLRLFQLVVGLCKVLVGLVQQAVAPEQVPAQVSQQQQQNDRVSHQQLFVGLLANQQGFVFLLVTVGQIVDAFGRWHGGDVAQHFVANFLLAQQGANVGGEHVHALAQPGVERFAQLLQAGSVFLDLSLQGCVGRQVVGHGVRQDSVQGFVHLAACFLVHAAAQGFGQFGGRHRQETGRIAQNRVLRLELLDQRDFLVHRCFVGFKAGQQGGVAGVALHP